MTKSKIVNHFSDHGILRTMERSTLLVLLNQFREVFEGRDIAIPAVDDSETEIPMAAIKEVLMGLGSDNAQAAELGDVLDDIVVASENYELFRPDFDELARKYESRLDGILPVRESDLAQAVALCLDELARADLSILLARIAVRDTKTFREYPWKPAGVPEEEDFDEGEESGEPDEFKCETNKQVIQAGLAGVKERIDEKFLSKNYNSRCHVYAYWFDDEEEVWFIVEHGGRKLTVEDFEPTSGQIKTVKYNPLARNVVVLSYRYRMMRIKAETEWQANLYLQQFGALLTKAEDGAFLDVPHYTFDPIHARSMARAFERGEFSEQIAEVIVSMIEKRTVFREHTPVYSKYSSKRDLSEFWQESTGTSNGEISKVGLDLKMYNPATGQKENVHVVISSRGSLRVGKAKYTTLIREWLRSRGFEIGYRPPALPECVDVLALQAEQDDSVFWHQVHTVWLEGKTSRNGLYARFGKRTADFVNKFMVHENNPISAQEWYDPHGKKWNVCQVGGAYYRYNEETEAPTIEHGKIDEREIEIMRLDKAKLVRDIQNALFKGSTSVKKIDDALNQTGIYNLGENYVQRILTYFYVPGEPSDAGFARVLAHNTEDANIPGRMVFFCMKEEPPTSDSEDVDAGLVQHIFIGDMVKFTSEGGLSLKEGAERLVTPPRYPADPSGFYSRWPLDYPLHPSYHHIDILLKRTTCYIKLGEHGKGFNYSDLAPFHQFDANHEGESANVTNLRKLITMNQACPNGWKLSDAPASSSLSRLSSELARFFGIQEPLYEPTRATSRSKTKLYRLCFGHAESNRD